MYDKVIYQRGDFNQKRLRGHPILAVGVTCLILFVGLPFQAQAEKLGTWNPTTSYPLALSGQACVTSLGFIYCVGGLGIRDFPPEFVNSTFFAPLTGSGVGSWSRTTDYPTNVALESCVTQSEYIYCLGGGNQRDTGEVVFDSAFFAPLTSSGIGPWIKTTSYPLALANVMCVAASGYVYCVGGMSSMFNPPTGVNSSYFAPLSSTGVGSWSNTTSLPIPAQQAASIACVAENGYVYCMRGGVQYAPITPSGIGTWSSETRGVNGQACVPSLGYVYCVGQTEANSPVTGVYFSQNMNPGLTPFLRAPNYPIPGATLESQYACLAAGYVFCVGGQACAQPPTGCKWTDAVYFAQPVPSQTVTIYFLCCNSHNSSFFFPQNVTVIVGLNNTVQWYNAGPPLNISAVDKSFTTGPIMQDNLSRPLVLSTPGDHSYVVPGAVPPPKGTVRVLLALIVTTTKTLSITTTSTATTRLATTFTMSPTTAIGLENPITGIPGDELTLIAITTIAAVGGAMFALGRRSRRPKNP